MMDSTLINTDLASLRLKLDELQRQVDSVEADELRQNSPHPSMNRFSIAEAIVDELFAAADKEKACTFEPNGKPCDHCSMCSARGF